MSFFEYFIRLGTEHGALGIFLGALLESVGVPFASVSLTLASGSLIASGKVTFAQVIIAGTLGNVIGSSLSYAMGYFFGDILRKHRKGKYVFKNENVIHEFIEKHGSMSVFLGQLYGTVRTFISFPAGMLKMNFKKFIIYTALGGMIFSATVSLSSMFIRDAYYKLLYPLIGLSFGSAAFLFMVLFVATHFSIRNHHVIRRKMKNLFSNEDYKDRKAKE